MNILFLGDVVAESGRNAVISTLPALKAEYSPDLTVVNGENAAYGKGITQKIYNELTEAGADIITLGNHAFSKREIIPVMDQCANMIRPVNMDGVGRTYAVREICGRKVAVINLLGRVFMDIATETPFDAMERILEKICADVIIVDIHAEATSEKVLFAEYFKERVTAVIGTHTHVQAADERIISGCAFITDAGMCGPCGSVLGRDREEVIRKVIFKEKTRFTPADTPSVICGVLVGINEETCRAESIRRIQIRP